MRIYHPAFSSYIELERGKINEIIIENPSLIYSIVSDIYRQTNKEDGETVLSDNGRIVEISRSVEMLTEFIPFDINRKHLLNRLSVAMKEKSTDESEYMASREICADICRYVENVISLCGGELTYDEPNDISGILKLVNLRFNDEYDSLAEKLLNYMMNVVEYDGEKCFILLNLGAFIEENEIQRLFDSILDHDISVLMIEDRDRIKSAKLAKTIIDGDLCMI